ncbi:WD repeat-containing protein 87 [Rhinatrema bivittatum]|uniref:WD repeat-containing protein 87 n=1 Tax=Rhinatrema bivittatum TaxID=194408 RepID=UPI00112769C3|nr:WD repeat-containing protein 87 [Rhinatrema bivittatum]XP_029427414.1 WD repeat-containing protein 87 [Rhinatrema bivittatum]XP_029427415.1 WD repeat-containing protein 87 [Rhinatrema bivittatum]
MLMGNTSCLIFSGHMSGQIKLISPQDYWMDECKIHNATVVTIHCLSNDDPHMVSTELRLLCSYGMDNYIYLSNIVMKAKIVTLKLLASIFCKCSLQCIMLVPEWLCTITAKNTIRLWKVEELLSSKEKYNVTKWKDNQIYCITSLDYCPILSLFLTGYQDGTVRVWDTKGNILAEFKISQNFQSTCFANPKADLLVAFYNNIVLIPCMQYLQDEQLKVLVAQDVADDDIEDPFPFLPNIFLSFDTVLVPKYIHSGKKKKNYEEMKSVKSSKSIVIKKDIDNVIKIMPQELACKSDSERDRRAERHELGDKPLMLCMMNSQNPFMSIQEQLQLNTLQDQEPCTPLPGLIDSKPVVLEIEPASFRKWPIAPGGYLPNSVIRAPMWAQSTPDYLLDFLGSHHESILEESTKEDQLKDQPTAPNLLIQIASSRWLGKTLNIINLDSVIQALIERMPQVPITTYQFCIQALIRILQTYITPNNLKVSIARRLYEDTCDMHILRRLEAWNALDRMHLLSLEAVNHLAKALLDTDVRLRDKARSLLASSAKITTKKSLLTIIQRNCIRQDLMAVPSEHKKEETETPEQAMNWKPLVILCQQLKKNLTNNLELVTMKAIKPKHVIKSINLQEATRVTEATNPIKAIKQTGATQCTESFKVMDKVLKTRKATKPTQVLGFTEDTKSRDIIKEAIKPMDVMELREVTSTIGTTKVMKTTKATEVMRLLGTTKSTNTTKTMQTIKSTKPTEAQKPMIKSTLSEDTLRMKVTDDDQDKDHFAYQTKPDTCPLEITGKKHEGTKRPTDMWYDSKMEEWWKEKAEILRDEMVEQTDIKTSKNMVNKRLCLWSTEQPVKEGNQTKAMKSTSLPNQTWKFLGHGDSTFNIYLTEVKSHKPPSEISRREGKQKIIKTTQLKKSPVHHLTSNSRTATTLDSHEALKSIMVPSAESHAVPVSSLKDSHGKEAKKPQWFRIDPSVHYDMDHTRWKEHLYKLIERHGFQSLKSRTTINDLSDGHRSISGYSLDKNLSHDTMDLQTAKGNKDLGSEMKDTMKLSAIILPDKEWDSVWPGCKMKPKRDITQSSARGKFRLPAPCQEESLRKRSSFKEDKELKTHEGRRETQLEAESVDQVFGRHAGECPTRQELSEFSEDQETHFSPLSPKIPKRRNRGAANVRELVSSLEGLQQIHAKGRRIRNNSVYSLSNSSKPRSVMKGTRMGSVATTLSGRSYSCFSGREDQIAGTALGERVLHRVLTVDQKEEPASIFYHVVPLFWKNSVQTSSHSGEVSFGTLKLDWTSEAAGWT